MKSVNIIAVIVRWAVIIVGLIFGAMSAMEADPMVEGSFTGTSITWAFIVLGIGVVGALVSTLAGLMGDKKSIIKTLIAIAGGAVLVFIAWSLGDSTPLVLPGYEGTENCYPWLNIADAGIYLFYFAAGVAFLSIIGSWIYSMFK